MTEQTPTADTTAGAPIDTVAVTTPAIAVEGLLPGGGQPAPASAADLALIRELVLRAHPDVVPDLIAGDSVDALLASVAPAHDAFQRVADAVRQGSGPETPATEPTPTTATPPAVPAGGAQNVVDPATLTPTTKIARALAERRSRSQ